MNYFILTFISLIVVCYCVYKKCYKNVDTSIDNFTNQDKCKEKTVQFVEQKPKKDLRRCTQYTRLYSRPNKCFSCEKDVLRNAGPKYINYAFPGKCFSCERQSKQPYHEGPTKCFSCE